PTEVAVQAVDGTRRHARAETIMIATGSRPRTPPHVPVDHENILDSDSILSLIYLPASLTVLGAGVIANEYASTFSALGVQVTMIDKGERPLGFLDPELTDVFLAGFAARGGRFLGGSKVASVASGNAGNVVTQLEDGETVTSEKMLCALGRVAECVGLDLETAGVAVNPQGYLQVDEHYRTSTPHIYAIGDVIGPPSLAATSMEQGRRAARHALGLAVEESVDVTPIGIYTIPEIGCVGLTEAKVRELRGGCRVGRARFHELARGQICGDLEGMLKLVSDPDDGRLL